MRNSVSSSTRPAQIEREIAEIFRRAGWVLSEPSDGADLLIRKKNVVYAVEIKAASEGRADRLVPLMAQAILQIQSSVRHLHGRPAPLAVVAAPRIAPTVLEQIHQFARVHAPDVAIGVVDLEGLREFSGKGLESLNARPPSQPSRDSTEKPRADLFSDLNQWMMKVLLAPYLKDSKLLNAPVGHYRNASELAVASRVSVMTAFRFIRQLKREGFVHESSRVIQLVRLEELLRRWQAAAIRPIPEIAVRSVVARDKRVQVQRVLAAHGDRACVALFAAAEALHLGFVHGVPAHIYVDDIHPRDLSQIGLMKAEQGRVAELILRVPSARNSVFRGALVKDGLRVCDALQVWLDVSNHPTRGKEQAHLIFNRVIKPMIDSARHARRQ